MYQKCGFTLIELLVVVLIIGILAAVALPQYQMAVKKSRFMTLAPIIKALASAEEVYYLANGSYASTFDQLDIEPPAGGRVEGGGTHIYYDPGFYCRLFVAVDSPNVYCHGTDYGYYRLNLQYGPGGSSKLDIPGQAYCGFRTDASSFSVELSRKLCRSFGGEVASSSTFEFWTMP